MRSEDNIRFQELPIERSFQFAPIADAESFAEWSAPGGIDGDTRRQKSGLKPEMKTISGQAATTQHMQRGVAKWLGDLRTLALL